MTTETTDLAELAAQWVTGVQELTALIIAQQRAQTAEVAELRDELHELAVTFRRHQAKAILRDVDDASAPTDEGRYGFYSQPRDCVCGDAHLSRSLYWDHRLAAEAS